MTLSNVEKKSFSLTYTLECGEELPLTLGYESYGELNADKSNVILISHYFSASSHAAGRYKGEDESVPAGYWDALIGPNKAIDTNKFFVISIDNLANVQAHNPKVITTGPRSINPKTGKRYGKDFPLFTFKDMAGIQKKFLNEELGIQKLYAVAGASAGGMISFSWIVDYPSFVERFIGVITNAQNPVNTSFRVLSHAMRAIEMDENWNNGNYEDDKAPNQGFELAIEMMNAGAFSPEFYERTYKRKSEAVSKDINQKESYEKELYAAVQANIKNLDASHWYYTCKATMLHDIARHFSSLEEALGQIKAKMLLISCLQDSLQPTLYNEKIEEILLSKKHPIKVVKIDSDFGHMAGVLQSHLFAEDIAKFLAD